MTDTSQEEVNDSTTIETEGGDEGGSDFVKVPKGDWEKTNQTLGSLKRELKDLKKPKASEETVQTKPDENKLLDKLEKMSLRQAGVTHPDDIELARNTAKKWNSDIDDVLSDDDFKTKLERQQTARANTAATSKVKGGAGTSQAKETTEYWLAKGVPPTPADIPDRKLRAKISLAMVKAAENGGKTFYND